MTSTLAVSSVGPSALLQDAGRPGWAHLGVGTSGAADRSAYDLANRLVGNLPGAACIEATFGSLEVRVERSVLMAVTGAPVEIRCGRRTHAVNASFLVPAGAVVTLGRPSSGMRSYLAVRGGLEGEEVLGSMAWDTMARLGTPPLESGSSLVIGSRTGPWPATDLAPVGWHSSEPLEVPLILGPRDDWFTDEAISRLGESEFVVTAETDRVGARLDGPELPRQRAGELASEGVVLGALQVPSNGRPTLFFADHPVTGGYPVVGVVPRPWVHRASQLVPGERLRFRARGRV